MMSSNPAAGELTPQQQQQQQQWLAMQQQYHQQWLAMQQHQQLMYQQQAPQFMPYYQQQQAAQIQSSSEENKTLWIGDLQTWMDEHYLHSCFAPSGEAVSVKLIRNKQTGQSERFGFIEFLSHAAAEKILQSYNGTVMPNTDQMFRLNWATFSTGERRQDAGSDQSIFVGDLASDVTDSILLETFSSRYSTVRGAKVVVDTNTGRSKGYGFVRFGDENERLRAMTEMNGQYCSSRPMRIGVATPKKPSTTQQQYSSQGSQSDGDTSNTTVFVGGLDSDVGDEELRHTFSQFGEVISVKIPIGKGCGFVQFADRSSAEVSIEQINGTVIGKQTVRLSWGRNPGNKQFRGESGNQWNGNSYGKQGYNGYQDPNMYGGAATAYGASTNGYGNQ
ncbi:polyadenylate-binding protein RBP47 isoform X2 [Daucus carota subsp. sativus]|uniref:polyadenylate-binding protein RBP47 isoform X2 n=1 Tax=Daucus carota subsp. sativus TaxID=79200 RepID=UPI0007EFC6D6|nr:PREDICTED: polyadenylate-binding protein RBP47-like isoform X2 [Daucus carota subsp. sativus]